MLSRDHTPGPWRVSKKTHSGRKIVCDTLGGQICYLWGRDSHDGTPNANLIARTPDFLDALQAIVALDEGNFDHPALFKQGPLSGNTRADMVRFARQALSPETHS